MIKLISEPPKHTFTKASLEGVYVIFKPTVYEDEGQE